MVWLGGDMPPWFDWFNSIEIVFYTPRGGIVLARDLFDPLLLWVHFYTPGEIPSRDILIELVMIASRAGFKMIAARALVDYSLHRLRRFGFQQIDDDLFALDIRHG